VLYPLPLSLIAVPVLTASSQKISVDEYLNKLGFYK